MTAFNIGGLASGIDTNSVVDQLMTTAALPQTALTNDVSRQTSIDTAYQSLNTALAAVKTAADALADPTAWTATAASSSATSVVASSDGTALPGTSATFSVTQVATAQISTVAAGAATIADPTAGIDVVGADGTTHHLALADGTAASVAAAINAANVGVRAALVQTDGGPVLQFSASGTGAAGAFTVNGLSAPVNTLVAAQNAQISVGTAGAGGYTVSSSTNTFTDAIPGVTFTVSAPATGVTITLTPDETSISTKAKALVDSVNSALAAISTDTAQGGVLAGDPNLEAIQQQLLSSVSHGTAAGASYTSQGISLTSTGTLTFDPKAFAAAYSADAAGTQRAAGTSLAGSYSTLAATAADPTTGTITGLINAGTAKITSDNTQIADWTTKLADQKQALLTKFASMEAMLSKLKSESSYLNSVFNSATTSSSSGSSTPSAMSTSA